MLFAAKLDRWQFLRGPRLAWNTKKLLIFLKFEFVVSIRLYHCLQNLFDLLKLFNETLCDSRNFVDLFLFNSDLVSNLFDLNLIGSNVIDKLIDAVERHPSLDLFHNCWQRHGCPLDVQISLRDVLNMFSFLPLWHILRIVCEYIFYSLWLVFGNKLLQGIKPVFSLFVSFGVVCVERGLTLYQLFFKNFQDVFIELLQLSAIINCCFMNFILSLSNLTLNFINYLISDDLLVLLDQLDVDFIAIFSVNHGWKRVEVRHQEQHSKLS